MQLATTAPRANPAAAAAGVCNGGGRSVAPRCAPRASRPSSSRGLAATTAQSSGSSASRVSSRVVARFRLQGGEPEVSSYEPHVRLQRRLLVPLSEKEEEADTALSFVVENVARRGDSIFCVHFARGEPSTALEHTFSLTPGGYSVHETTTVSHVAINPPPGTSALTRPMEQWARGICSRYGLRLMDAGVKLSVRVLPEKGAAGEALPVLPLGKDAIGRAICAQGERFDADLTVVAPPKRSGIVRWATGSVEDTVLRRCSRPVAVVHGPVRPAAAAGGVGLGASAGRQLLLAVDGTDDSYAAVRWLLQHVHRAADTIRLVHVVPCLDSTAGSTMADGQMGGYDVDEGPMMARAGAEVQKWEREKAHVFSALLEEAGARFSMDVLVEPTEDVTSSISEAICRKAGAVQASLVVLSHHHHPALTSLMLGSVVDRVAHQADVPVVVLQGHSVREPRQSRGVV